MREPQGKPYSVKYGTGPDCYYILYDSNQAVLAEYHPHGQLKPDYLYHVPEDIKATFERTPHLLTRGAQRYER